MKTVLSTSVLGALACTAICASAHADDWSAEISGRLMIDYTIADADNSDLDVNASELRRARLGVSGSYGSILKYKLEFNTNSSGDVNAEDAYLEWKPEQFNGWALKAGQFKTPNSLDEQTSSRFISTLERAAFTDAFAFNRRIGVALSNSGDNWTFSSGVFGENLEVAGDEEGYALAARGTYVPLQTDETLIHLGASLRYREAGDDSGLIRYRQRPYTHIPGRVVSTGSIAESDTFLGVEAAAITGQAWLAGEYGMSSADSSGAIGEDQDVQGYYLEAGYFFGGRKTYKGGKFNRPKVDNPITDSGMGAVSVVVRYDALDLNDAIDGGEIDTLVLGADWWPTKNSRIGINYFNADADLGVSTSGVDAGLVTEILAGTTSDTVSGVVARLQFDF